MLDSIMFSVSPSQLIRQRYSCRTYQKRPLANQDVKILENYFQKAQPGPRGNQIRCRILTASEFKERHLPKPGTYGFIKDPAAYIVGTTHDQPGALEDFGYSMELLVLKATELEIGSCWLGASLTKNRFANILDLGSGEIIPAVISLGYPSDQKAWMDRVCRISAGADRRLPWEELFFAENWETSLNMAEAGSFLEPLLAVRLGPSASNKQPWRLLREGDKWHFYLKRTPNYPPQFLGDLLQIADLQRIDIGIAMAHFALSLQEEGLRGNWVASDPALEHAESPPEYIITWQAA